jgi:signal transduction histidine kinase
VPDSLFTTAARRHIALLVRALAPLSAGLNRQLKPLLRDFGPEQKRAFLAILPSAASPLGRFLEQVGYNGRRLAKLNVAMEQAVALLRRFDAMAGQALGGRFAPAREQLLLATLHTLHVAFYEVREAEAQAFFGIYRAETEAADLDDLLRRFVGVLTRTFGARAGRLVLAPRTAAPRPLYIERASSRERLIADPAMRGRYASYWSYPLAAPGVIQLAFAKPYPWLPRELALLAAVAARCEEAIERSRRESTIRRLEAEARATEEEERRRIGRELHDEAGQSLMVLRLRLEMMERDAPDGLRQRLAEARDLAGSTVVELRRIIAALSPTVLERLGIEAALRQLAVRFRRNHDAVLRLRIAMSGEAPPKEVQEVLYRVAQECLQNVVKHSGASHVNLSLRATDRTIRLSVSDDGAGFSADSARCKPMSFGLAGMRERAALIGGNLAVRSAPTKGTTVTLELPRQSTQVKYGKDSRPPH